MSNKVPEDLKILGKKLLEQLDTTSYKPTSMLWTDSLKTGRWILVIGTLSARLPEGTPHERVKKKHDTIAADVSKLIQRIAGKESSIEFAIVAPSNKLLERFGALIETDEDAFSEIEIRDSLINDIPTGSNFIYRLSLR